MFALFSSPLAWRLAGPRPAPRSRGLRRPPRPRRPFHRLLRRLLQRLLHHSWLLLFAAGSAVLNPVLAQDVAQDQALGRSAQGLLSYARAHNPELRAMQQEAEAAAQRIGPAGALPDPVLRAELMNIGNRGNSAGPNLLPWKVGETKYTLMQRFPLWGKRGLQGDAANANARSADARAEATWAELSTRIKTTYAAYYRTAGTQRLVAEMLELVTRLEQIAQARYAGGLNSPSDAIRAQLEQSALRTELIVLDSERQRQQATLNALLARDGAAPLVEPEVLRALPDLNTADAPALSARARERNPQIVAETARVVAARSRRELTLRNRYPDLLVGLSPTQVRSRIDRWGVMIEMNIPLWQDTRRSQESEADALLRAAQLRVDALANQLTGELAAQLAALQAARRNESLLTTQLLPQTELSLQSALAAYENGRADFTVLLEAQREIRRARQELLKTQAEAQMRLADMEGILGEDL